MKKQYLFLALILILLSIGAFQPFGCMTTITGTVTDTDSSLVEGAVVTISDNFDTFTSSTTTNSYGIYTFVDVPYGDYIISAVHTDCVQSTTTISTSYFENGLFGKAIEVNDIKLTEEEEEEQSEAHELPDTGQEQSYTTTFGEDHDYQPTASQPLYTDNGDGTITDNRTGLMWVKDGDSAGCNNGNGLTWEQALTLCEGLDYAGYSDWRLPNARELESIVDAGEMLPAINTTYFPNTKSDDYWTSTTYMLNTSCAWGVRFTSGLVRFVIKTNSYYVRPVRGSPVETESHELPDTGQEQSYTTIFGEDHDYQPTASQPLYTDNGDGTITDNRTGLMWVKDGDSAGCNNGNGLTWEQALTLCEGLDYADYSDWRLPNGRELMSISDFGKSNPAINTTYFPNTKSDDYWTSTTYVMNTSYAWFVYFANGGLDNEGKTNSYYVRPVRGGP